MVVPMKSYSDIVGDGGSRIFEQVTEQRQRVAAKLEGVRHRLAIGSGKGGVGKSTLTLGLAAALRAKGLEVAVLDADINGPSQARLAGIGAAPLVPDVDGLAVPKSREGIGIVSLGSLVPESEAVTFDSVAKGDSHTWRATREFAFLGQLLGSIAWGKLDFLLYDLPPGAERTFQYAEFLGPETAFCLVTMPSDLSRGVVARSVAALRDTANPVLGYVENMAGYFCEGCGEVKALFPATGTVPLDIPLLGSVPFDPQFAAAGDGRLQMLDEPERASSQALMKTADAIIRALGDQNR
jgi:ATP-binding protein involved in chromosome partitioning